MTPRRIVVPHRWWLAGVLALVVGCQTVPDTAEPTDEQEAAAMVEAVTPESEMESAETAKPAGPPTGAPLRRTGDEIVVAGQFFHTGTPVVLWLDPGGYDGYRVERRYGALERADWERSVADNPTLTTPNRFGLRRAVLTAAEAARVRGGGWELPLLQRVVDQLVLHYDAAGTSRVCFERLHDDRGLSIHFMVAVDGTIYQTLDLKERAWHATVANSRSIGIEIAHVGAYAPDNRQEMDAWYDEQAEGGTRLVIPQAAHPESVRTPDFVGRPARPEAVTGRINGEEFVQYDFTPEQYTALARLSATLATIFPKLPLDYPRDADGHLLLTTMPEDAWRGFHGLIGHWHIQTNKIDPGPALDWDRLVDGARALLPADE